MDDKEIYFTVKDILNIAKKTIEFPYSRICKHLVASDLLSLLVQKGYNVPESLAESVVKADDDKSLAIFDELLK